MVYCKTFEASVNRKIILTQFFFMEYCKTFEASNRNMNKSIIRDLSYDIQ